MLLFFEDLRDFPGGLVFKDQLGLSIRHFLRLDQEMIIIIIAQPGFGFDLFPAAPDIQFDRLPFFAFS